MDRDTRDDERCVQMRPDRPELRTKGLGRSGGRRGVGSAQAGSGCVTGRLARVGLALARVVDRASAHDRGGSDGAADLEHRRGDVKPQDRVEACVDVYRAPARAGAVAN